MTRGERKVLPPPPFTAQQLRDAIPRHLFERSLLKSSAYLLRDLSFMAFMFWVGFALVPLLPLWARVVAWPVYWWAQGLVSTGTWVIAHECGHHAFSDYKTLNYTVGWVLHSALLVPFHSWRISHSKHHKTTNDMDRDQVFVPPYASEVSNFEHVVKDSPIGSLVLVLRMALLGWPAYVLFDTTSSSRFSHKGRIVSHLDPYAPLFRREEFYHIVVSDLGVIAMLCVLGYLAYTVSVWAVFTHYVMPYLWVNYWLVAITFLQHTHRDVPHYRGAEWTFVRGALATVDRDYGFVDFFQHNIGSSHVMHHLFSDVPHYNAIKATPYLRKALGEFYVSDNTSIVKSLFRTVLECYCVDDTGSVLFFRSAKETPRAVKAE